MIGSFQELARYFRTARNSPGWRAKTKEQAPFLAGRDRCGRSGPAERDQLTTR
jgi:hypothetical protein